MSEIQNKKVFFITSNESQIENVLKYSYKDNPAIINFKNEYKKEQKHKTSIYNVKVYSFEVIVDSLNDKNFDKETKKYISKIMVTNQSNESFYGNILFKKEKNNFIYDFKFKENGHWTYITYPPNCIKFTKKDQLKIFNEVLIKLNFKQKDHIYIDMILDSQNFLREKYDFDYFLDILKCCYSQNEVKTLLMAFKLERVNLPQKLDVKKYSSLLGIIGKKPEIIVKFCKVCVKHLSRARRT